ncbi:MAG: 50S ribosomal protein L4 [Eubacteriales bacterium]|nr:50S ribosomal protein L4 [Eubacteriales bacterium]
MPNIAVYNMEGKQVGDIELNDEVFGVEFNHAAVHQVVKAQLANKRQGTKSALTRTEVAGGGKKPYKQKGTGHARQGSTRAPQWYKGGVVFAPKPRDFRLAVPKKLNALAMKCALSSHVKEDTMKVLDAITFEAPKTAEMVKMLKALNTGKKTLVVTAEKEENAVKSARNIPNVKLSVVNNINVLDILNADSFIITKEAVEMVQEVYA